MLYNKFSEYLKNKYGTKVYKLPVNLPCTCPNRDGTVGTGGCIFCGEEGAGFELLSPGLEVKEQLKRNSAYIGSRYGSARFIAYFQNYTNTYLPEQQFMKAMRDACAEGVVALYISTRPDSVPDAYLEFLGELQNDRKIDVIMELGLQTVNYKTLRRINRGHTLAEFIDAVRRVKGYGLGTCAHYIVDFPWDTREDTVEGAKVLSALAVDQVKCHSLFILDGTPLGEMYRKGEVSPVSLEEYEERVIAFLEYLNPEIVIQRLIGRAPEERTLFCNWGMSWWKIRDRVEEKMLREGRFQGGRFHSLHTVPAGSPRPCL